MNRAEAKKIALTSLSVIPQWVKAYVHKDEKDGLFYHYWPDNTMFGPFSSWMEAALDSVAVAHHFDNV